MRALARFAWGLVLAAGWIACALVVSIVVFERSGILADTLRKELRARAGDLHVELEDARIAFFDTRLSLYGLQLGEGSSAVRIDKLELRWGVDTESGFGVRGLLLRGGRLRLSSALLQQFEERLGPGTDSGSLGRLPPIEMRGFGVEIESERWGGFANLGLVDLRARASEGGIQAEGALHRSVGEVYLHGSLGADRKLVLETLATGLPVSASYLPSAWHAFQPQGSLALEGHVEADLRPEGHATGRLRLALGGASLLVAGGKQHVDHVQLEFDGHVEAEDVGKALDPGSWECTLETSGTWEGRGFSGWGFLGPALASGSRARGFLHLSALPLDGSLVDLLAQDAAQEKLLRERWDAFTPKGEAELWASFELPEPPPGMAPALGDLRIAAEAQLAGAAGLAYRGWPQDDGSHDAGFPLPLEGARGAVVFTRDPKAKRPNLLGLVDLRGTSVCGEIRAQGLVHSHAVDAPPTLPGAGASEFDLNFEAHELAHTQPLEEALAGLGEAVPADSTWRPYRPQGGKLDIEHLRLVRKVDMPFAACDLALGLTGITLDWNEISVPLANATGKLAFRSDGKGERGLAAQFEAGLPSKDARIALSLRYQTDPSLPHGAAGKSMDELSCVEARVTGLSLKGAEKQALAKRFPDVDTALERMSPKGFVDVDLQRVQAGAAAPARWRAELTPIDVQLQPQSFKVNTKDVHGRVIVTVEEPRDPAQATSIETALAPLAGVSQGIGRMAFAGRLPGAQVELWAAGIHLDDGNVRGALGEGANKFDMSGFGVQGPVDLSGRILLETEQSEGFGLAATIYLRGNTFRTQPHELVLKNLHGRLELEKGVLTGPELHALLGRTEVVLRGLDFHTTDDRFQLGVALEAHGLPLDREHLTGFMDEKTLTPLLEELHLEGTLDIESGRIDIEGHSASDSQLVFRGEVLVHDTSVQLGLPWKIRSARASIEKLLLEGGRLRAMARVHDLEGTLAEREVSKASMLLTYVEPQLAIEDLEADLEGGKLYSLGAADQRSGTALSIGLEKPYVFQLALDLEGVDIGRLLHGMFESDFATKGSLKAQLRLQGNTENVLDVKGSGAVYVSDSRLWSIPVFRELFSQIGFANAGVFKSMFANLRLDSGRLYLNDITVYSDLLQLRGEHGWIDGDGDMQFDFELRYSIIDNLGPITRLLYWVQNRLLSVSIRGDMARPSVVLKNPISSLFGGGQHRRALPLPPFSPLPPRF
ncbi:MAG: hypothetical protein IPJ19_19435 [Planctomycetes bacterium]|nr:hypothetical protein [Planctomycetota bacterium]